MSGDYEARMRQFEIDNPHPKPWRGPTIAANVTPPEQRADRLDPQLSPWAQEKNRNTLAAAMATFSAQELGTVIAAALLQRFGAHEAGNILTRADRVIRNRP